MHNFLSQIAGFEGVIQTSGFIPPGKTNGKLEIYNEETRDGNAKKLLNYPNIIQKKT